MSIITVALPLSAGRILMLVSVRKCLSAICSSLLRFGLGASDFPNISLIFHRNSSAWGSSIGIELTELIMSSMGSSFGAVVKFSPLASSAFSVLVSCFQEMLIMVRCFWLVSVSLVCLLFFCNFLS